MRIYIAEFTKFGAVGTIGFLVDAFVLIFMINKYDWGLYESRVLSFAFAVTCTWYLNRSFTFSNRTCDKRKREYSIYFILQSIGALINFVVYAIFIYLVPVSREYPVLPLAVGSGVAMFFNFLSARRFAFRVDMSLTAKQFAAPQQMTNPSAGAKIDRIKINNQSIPPGVLDVQ